MCGRYTLTADPDAIQLAFALDSVDGHDMPRYNIAPSQQVAVITDREPKKLSFMRWGLIPSWAKDPKIGNRMINARSETAADKAILPHRIQAAALPDSRRRLLRVDETGQEEGAGLYSACRASDIFAFAGLWESWKNPQGEWLNSCTILTTEANEKLRPIHHRMAVILEPPDQHLWLSPRELLPGEWLPLMTGPEAEQLKLHEVSTDVNRPVNDNPTLVAPVSSIGQQSLL